MRARCSPREPEGRVRPPEATPPGRRRVNNVSQCIPSHRHLRSRSARTSRHGHHATDIRSRTSRHGHHATDIRPRTSGHVTVDLPGPEGGVHAEGEGAQVHGPPVGVELQSSGHVEQEVVPELGQLVGGEDHREEEGSDPPAGGRF
ncbi:hypothetical protein EYF80_061845 [Liparis tanakae]|uniref:Uncharacterized protein n=1 Tax=Liparis tanakae TaxID=230148 RepID=A0A4Z2EGZ6_9TELE|nr:hypothetical protein EYF80_061845 [Liparis tanakae]